MLLFVEAHPDKTLKTPETLSLCVRQINTAEKRKRKKQQSRWRQSHDKRSASDWESERERERVCVVCERECVCAHGSTLFPSHTFRPHLLMLPAARSFHNLSHSQKLLPTARNLLPNLIITLQTLVTIALWERIHTHSLQWLWPPSQNCQFNHN